MSEGYFAQIETSFFLTDARLDEMTNTEKVIYITLWCLAVDTRKSTLTFPNLPRTLGRLSRNDARTIRPALAKLRELCLIEMVNENTITVCGVREKHPKLKWKDDRVETTLKVSQGYRAEQSRAKQTTSPNPVSEIPKNIVPKNQWDIGIPKNWVNEINLAYDQICEKYFKNKYIDPFEHTKKFITWYRQHPAGVKSITLKKQWATKLTEWLDKEENTQRTILTGGGA